MIDITQLITAHPGGYEDIHNFLKENFGKVKAIGITSVPDRVQQILDNGWCTGVAASMIIGVLADLKLPTPDHKDWLKPCAFWDKPKKKGKTEAEDTKE